MSGPRVRARLADASGELVNLSLPGALVELNAPVEVDSERPLTLNRGSLELTLTARVARVSQAGGRKWRVAMAFTDRPAEARKIIPRFLSDDPV
jgi:hypothetical protein